MDVHFVNRNRGLYNPTISQHYIKEIYDNSLKKLARGKALGPGNILNEIFKALPPLFLDYFSSFFTNVTNRKTSLQTHQDHPPTLKK